MDLLRSSISSSINVCGKLATFHARGAVQCIEFISVTFPPRFKHQSSVFTYRPKFVLFNHVSYHCVKDWPGLISVLAYLFVTWWWLLVLLFLLELFFRLSACVYWMHVCILRKNMHMYVHMNIYGPVMYFQVRSLCLTCFAGQLSKSGCTKVKETDCWREQWKSRTKFRLLSFLD